MENQCGVIVHGAEVYWVQGPLPSPKTAKRLVELFNGVYADPFTDEERQCLNSKWHIQDNAFGSLLKKDLLHRKRLVWAIDLEDAQRRAGLPQNVADVWALVQESRIEVKHDTGPQFPPAYGDNWTGESCPSTENK